MKHTRSGWWGLGVFLLMIPGLVLAEDLESLRQELDRQGRLLRALQGELATRTAQLKEVQEQVPPSDWLDQALRDLRQLKEDQTALQGRLQVLEEAPAPVAPPPRDDRLLEGLLLLQSGATEEGRAALEALTEAPEYQQQEDKIWGILGQEALRDAQPRKASYYFGMLIRRHPGSVLLPVALYGLGQAFAELGEAEKQRLLWAKLAVEFPQHPLALEVRRQLRPNSGAPSRKNPSSLP
jgi:tetratricopeptide (TPR) repeat protein